MAAAADGGGAGATLEEIGVVTLLPALAMAFGSMAISMGEPSESLQARFQHLSAGLLTGAVITDIFPILRSRLVAPTIPGQPTNVEWANLAAGLVGFVAALLLMYSLKGLELEEEEGGDLDAAAGKQQVANQAPGNVPLLTAVAVEQAQLDLPPPCEQERRGLKDAIGRLAARAASLEQLVAADEVDREAVDEEVHGIDFHVDAARRRCRGPLPFSDRDAKRLQFHADQLSGDILLLRKMDIKDLHAIDKQLRTVANTLRHIHSHAERAVFRRWGTTRASADTPRTVASAEVARPAALPWGLVLAVVIDSMVDGMLIGLAASVDKKSGWLMAIATAIEMGFLGYSFACAVTKSSRAWAAILLLFVPPLAMLGASVAAAAGASDVENRPAFVGLIAFSLVALLFLVVEELLLEAHEKEGSDAWHISAWLYIGLLLSICMDVFV